MNRQEQVLNHIHPKMGNSALKFVCAGICGILKRRNVSFILP
jgi:hypothetical protein